MKPVLLVVEDASEYAEFARLFLSDVADLRTAQSGAEALAVLGRGFALARREDGRVVRDAAEVAPGERLALRFSPCSAAITWTRS